MRSEFRGKRRSLKRCCGVKERQAAADGRRSASIGSEVTAGSWVRRQPRNHHGAKPFQLPLVAVRGKLFAPDAAFASKLVLVPYKPMHEGIHITAVSITNEAIWSVRARATLVSKDPWFSFTWGGATALTAVGLFLLVGRYIFDSRALGALTSLVVATELLLAVTTSCVVVLGRQALVVRWLGRSRAFAYAMLSIHRDRKQLVLMRDTREVITIGIPWWSANRRALLEKLEAEVVARIARCTAEKPRS
jgi:hypothetical protein